MARFEKKEISGETVSNNSVTAAVARMICLTFEVTTSRSWARYSPATQLQIIVPQTKTMLNKILARSGTIVDMAKTPKAMQDMISRNTATGVLKSIQVHSRRSHLGSVTRLKFRSTISNGKASESR